MQEKERQRDRERERENGCSAWACFCKSSAPCTAEVSKQSSYSFDDFDEFNYRCFRAGSLEVVRLNSEAELGDAAL